MGKKKAFISKSSSTTFSLVRRSQRDVTNQIGEEGSKFVLVSAEAEWGL